MVHARSKEDLFVALIDESERLMKEAEMKRTAALRVLIRAIRLLKKEGKNGK
jgi:hypothetical protein